MAYYDIGDMVRFGNDSGQTTAAAFTTIAGTATDPTAVTLTVVQPDGTDLVYGWPSAGADGTMTRESAGRFYMDVELDADGEWRYLLAGTGAVQASAEGVIYVRKRRT